MVSFQALQMVGHTVHAVCPDKKQMKKLKQQFMTLKVIKTIPKNQDTILL
jgi:hypothetical protein